MGRFWIGHQVINGLPNSFATLGSIIASFDPYKLTIQPYFTNELMDVVHVFTWLMFLCALRTDLLFNWFILCCSTLIGKVLVFAVEQLMMIMLLQMLLRYLIPLGNFLSVLLKMLSHRTHIHFNSVFAPPVAPFTSSHQITTLVWDTMTWRDSSYSSIFSLNGQWM